MHSQKFKVRTGKPKGEPQVQNVRIRGRRRGRNAWNETIQRFNELVKAGKISNVSFNPQQTIIGADGVRNLTRLELEKLGRMVTLSQEPTARRVAKVEPKIFGRLVDPKKVTETERDYINERWDRFHERNAKKGGYKFIHPVVEFQILSQGTNGKRELAVVMDLANRERPESLAPGFETEKDVVENCMKELQYWGKEIDRMKKRNPKFFQRTIDREISDADMGETIVKKVNGNIVMETSAKSFGEFSGEHFSGYQVFRKTLTTNGKFIYEFEFNGKRQWIKEF